MEPAAAEAGSFRERPMTTATERKLAQAHVETIAALDDLARMIGGTVPREQLAAFAKGALAVARKSGDVAFEVLAGSPALSEGEA